MGRPIERMNALRIDQRCRINDFMLGVVAHDCFTIDPTAGCRYLLPHIGPLAGSTPCPVLQPDQVTAASSDGAPRQMLRAPPTRRSLPTPERNDRRSPGPAAEDSRGSFSAAAA